MIIPSTNSQLKELPTNKASNHVLIRRLLKPDMTSGTKNMISKNNANSESIGVEKFNPDNN
jgi:hypothetical protein